ncbi:MAG TPA: hypothetical protein VGK19_16405 [Capsulimonadaceae bacterium]|jgi:hypothetical protein
MPKEWYTAGYLGLKVDELESVRSELEAIIVDIRFRPQSRLPMWRQATMIRTFGSHYLWCQDWGSPNFKNGPPHTLLDANTGWLTVSALERPVILLCACREASACHRTTLAAWLRTEHGIVTRELCEYGADRS